MKTLTVRIPERLFAQIDAESRRRKVSRSRIVRERLERDSSRGHASVADIAELIGSVDGLPRDLSSQKKRYLRTTRYGA
jgi:hypothetical protein